MSMARPSAKSRGIRRLAGKLRRTPLHPQWLLGSPDKFVDWITPHLKGVVVDVGCGNRWLQRHVGRDDTYFGLDSIETGRELYGARPDVHADAAFLPLSTGSVDCLALLDVLEHLERPRRALKEAARVLRPGGRLVLSVPFLYPIHDAPFDFQRYTMHGLMREVDRAGLTLSSLEATGHAAESAGLLAALACGGSAQAILRHSRKVALILLPLPIAAIPLINIVAWVAARILPDWPALTSGYRLVAIKPA